MKINIGNLVFCPRLITTIFAVIFFLLFIYLGFWQLDRAEQKREFQSFYNERHQEEIINLNNNLISNTSDFLWRRVSATGIFLEEQQILLDNQVNAGQAGYYVYTPFKIKNSPDIFLINRGWVPVGKDRNKSPKLIFTEGEVTIEGVFKKEPRTGVLLMENNKLYKDIINKLAPGTLEKNPISSNDFFTFPILNNPFYMRKSSL